MASYKKVILKSDNISELTNDAGYITSVGSVSWGDISGKPNIFMHDYATVTGNPTFAGTTTFTGDIYTSGHIRPTDGVLTLYDNTSGSWGRLSAQGVNLGDWYRQPTYGQIAVGAYTFRVFKGDSYGSTTLVSVNQSGVMQLGDGGNSTNWNSAYSWGNHADAGYSKFSGSYDDLTNKPSLDGNIVYNQNIQPVSIRQYWADSTPSGVQFNNAFSAPNGADTRAVYFDGGPGASSVSTWYGVANKPFSAIDVSQTYLSIWTNNVAGAWNRMLDVFGDHSLVRANVNFQSTGVITASGGDSTGWNQAYSWGNHASAGYLTSVPSSLGSTTFTGDVLVSEYIRHFEDNDTNIRFQTDHIDFTTSAGLALRIDDSQKATFSQGVSVINSVPFLYVGDNVNNNTGTWDANMFLDSHANARLRIQQRSDAKNLELWVHGGYEPLIQATDSANYLRLGVGGNVGLELGKYSVHLKKATYVESLRADNSSGLITIYNQGYGSKGNLDLNNITGTESTFTTRVNTGQVRFTDGSKTSFNHLNVSAWQTAYNWGNHASAGYSTFSGSYDDLTNNPTINASAVYNQTINPSKVQIMSGDNRTKVSFWNGSTYGIGMHSGISLGAVSDFAMTFQMNNQASRGFWWGHSLSLIHI